MACNMLEIAPLGRKLSNRHYQYTRPLSSRERELVLIVSTPRLASQLKTTLLLTGNLLLQVTKKESTNMILTAHFGFRVARHKSTLLLEKDIPINYYR
jgi:hypothetical protein